tara:strand:+ start:3073 stop:3819 length:747 start_codon:yes stop_codon:yes gene_type:complete
MKKIIQETFDKIFCINLDERTDRWDYCKSEFSKYDIYDIIERYPGTKIRRDPSKVKSITTSHINIIKLAKQKKYKSVLIFEDDVKFIDYKYSVDNKKYDKSLHTLVASNGLGLNKVPSNPRDVLQTALTQLKNHTWDILLLGCQIVAPKPYVFYEKLDTNLFKSAGMTRLHAYAVHSRAYDTIIDNVKPEYTYMFDRVVREYLSHRLNCITICPIICTQNSNLISDRKSQPVSHEVWTNKMLKTYYES